MRILLQLLVALLVLLLLFHFVTVTISEHLFDIILYSHDYYCHVYVVVIIFSVVAAAAESYTIVLDTYSSYCDYPPFAITYLINSKKLKIGIGIGK